MKKKPEITTEDWLNDPAWAEMDRLMESQRPPTGPEWFTNVEFADRYGMKREAARKRLVDMVHAGVAEKWLGNVDGKITSKYRLVKKTGAKTPCAR